MGCNAHNHPRNCDCGWGGDTGGGTGAAGSFPHLPDRRLFVNGVQCWDIDVGSRLSSYTIPNARCPKCRAHVFFYQNEHGGRVFFDPPLGPPWDKHPCTDNSAKTPGKFRQKLASGVVTPSSAPSEPLPLYIELHSQSAMIAKAIITCKETGWHPLLNVNVQNIGGLFRVQGIDPIDDRRYSIIGKTQFIETAPIYIRISARKRLTCRIEQVRVSRLQKLTLIQDIGWLGVETINQVRMAKKAKGGDVDAMRSYARSRSYHYLGTDNQIHEVSQWLDLESALFWFAQAIEAGSDEARIEHAYLMDIIAQSKRPPRDRSDVLRASLADAICRKVESLRHARLEALRGHNQILNDYYARRVLNAERALSDVPIPRLAPQLNAAIKSIIMRSDVQLKT